MVKPLDVAPIPVSVVDAPPSQESVAVEFGVCSNWSVNEVGTSQPVQILQWRPTRDTALIRVGDFGAGGATSVIIAHRQDYLANPNNPQGYIIDSVPTTIKWENQQPCFAAAIGGGPVIVSTLDQAANASVAEYEEYEQTEDYPKEEYQQEGAGYAPGAGNEY